MKTVKRICATAMGTLLAVTIAMGQGPLQISAKPPALLPPSPEAFQFTRYGNLPIGLNTGAAQFSVPVYTVRSGSLSHAIGIGYSTNGVKVDEQAGRTGLGWSLRAGGTVTRTVMDRPDGGAGIQPAFYHGNTNDTPGNWQLYNYVRQASNNTPPDFQPDEYSFSVDGLSGKFTQREDGSFALFGASGVRIEKNANGFLITGPNGVRYQFYLAEAAKNYGYPLGTTLEWVPAPVPTAWYLTKVLAPNRADSIVFNYGYVNPAGDHVVTYNNGISQQYGATILNPDGLTNGGYMRVKYDGGTDAVTGIGGCSNAPGLGTTIQMTDNIPYCLSSISFSGGTLQFRYSNRDDAPGEKKLDSINVYRNGDGYRLSSTALGYVYSNASNTAYDTYVANNNYTGSNPHLRKRLFLAFVRELGANGETGAEHTFSYNDINGLPPRLSFAQDRYGAFNGKANGQYFFPNDTWFDWHLGNNGLGADRSYNFGYARKGALEKIVYPTGGYTTVVYGPNKIAGDYAFKVQSDSVFALMDTTTVASQVAWSDTIHHDGGNLRLRASCGWASVPLDGMGENGGYTGLEGSWYVTWELVNESTNTCAKACGQRLYPGQNAVDGHFGFGLAPGVYRIKLTASQPNLRARFSLERWQRYADHSASAGIAGIRVQGLYDYTDNGVLAGRRQYIYGNWGDSTNSSGTGLQEDDGFNGREVGFSETLQGSVQGGNGPVTCGYNTIGSSSVGNNFLTDNGTVFYTKVIEIATDATGTKNNGGTENEFYYQSKKTSLPLRFNWYNGSWWQVRAVPTAPGAPLMNNDFLTGMPKASRVFTYSELHGSRNILKETTNYYSVDTPTLAIDTFLVSRLARPMPDGEGISVTDIPTGLQTYFYQYDMYRYWRYFGFAKLDSTVATDYSGAVPMKNKTGFSNHSLKNYLPRITSYTAANGNNKSIARKYTGDVLPSESGYGAVYLPMVNANIIDALVEETSVENGNDLEKNRMAYSGYPALDGGIQYLSSAVYSTRGGAAEKLQLANQVYDSSGNLLQYTDKSGMTTAIIWGYGGQYPVAQVTGKAYADALSQSNINMAVVNGPSTEAALLTELNKLRTLTACQVVTRTYNPMIGVSSQTGVDGRTVYYLYDAFNRLKAIKDEDGNTVKAIDEQFKATMQQ